VEVAQPDTASRLVSGKFPMSASATGEAIETTPALRTLPVIVIALLGTAIVGVMLVSETVSGEAEVPMAVMAVSALAMGTDVRIASSAAEAACRHTLLGIWRAVTSRPPGTPARPGLSGAHWER